MRYVILHYHILKNAGATVEEFLHDSFQGRLLRFDTPDRDASVPSADLLPLLESNPNLKAVSSHQIRHPLPVAPGFIFLDICFLRDPIDRVRSMYDYFRDKPVAGDPVSELANRLDLGEFVARLVEEIPWYANDIQVNLLANGIANDPPEPKDLDRAIERMLETSFLGVVDRFNESVAAGQYFLNPVFPELNCSHPPVNVSNRARSTLESRNRQLKDACDSAVYAKLLNLNALDFELVERARAEVRRRFELLPDQKACMQAAGGDPNSDWIVAKPRIKRPSPEAAPPALSPSPVTKLKRLLEARPHLRRDNQLFDANFYRASYPGVAGDPLRDFILAGAFEGRNPHPLFDASYYLRKYPDVAKANLNPLVHYLKHGAAEGRQPHPLFDPVYYLEHNPDVRESGMNPLIHYLLHGARENRRPHRWFAPEYYRLRCPDARDSENPLMHFVLSDPSNCSSPHPLFDCQYYLQAHPEVARNPLVHWLLTDPQSPTPEDSQFLQLNVEDVDIAIAFSQAPPAGAVGVWRDPAGRTRFIAPPQQRPFFESLSYDQLHAQGTKPCLSRAENS